MKKQRIVWLLLLAAFVGLMGFSEPALAAGFVPPAWSQKLPATQRFQLVLDYQAVLDKETGLVWERSPSGERKTWGTAVYDGYNNYQVGGRKGWRLPTVEELASLLDMTRVNPALPNGHPFTNVHWQGYWSITTDVEDTGRALIVDFGNGVVEVGSKSSVDFTRYVWYVRGGHGYDAY